MKTSFIERYKSCHTSEVSKVYYFANRCERKLLGKKWRKIQWKSILENYWKFVRKNVYRKHVALERRRGKLGLIMYRRANIVSWWKSVAASGCFQKSWPESILLQYKPLDHSVEQVELSKVTRREYNRVQPVKYYYQKCII